MGFKGIIHPLTKEEIVPKIKQLVSGAIEHLEKREEETVSKEETIGFLEMVLRFTEPSTGYFYCPNIPEDLKDGGTLRE